MSTTLILRDETAAADLVTEATWPDPVIAYPDAQWQRDINNGAITQRMVQLTQQAELYIAGGSTHTFTVKRNSVVVTTKAPPVAFTTRVFRIHAGVTLLWTLTADTPEKVGPMQNQAQLAVALGNGGADHWTVAGA